MISQDTSPNLPPDPTSGGHWWEHEAHVYMFAIAILHGIFGLSLLFQPSRWDRTPAYAEILDIAPQSTWGAVFVLVAVLMVIAVIRFPRLRQLGMFAVGVCIFFDVAWTVAFLHRFFTNDSTTPVTWGFWGFLLLPLLRALYQLASGADERA